MKTYLHNLIVGWVATLFAPVKLPEDLKKVAPELNHTILITQSHSLVIEALLISFAKQLGLDSVERLDQEKLYSIKISDLPTFKGLTWASMHDLPRNSALRVDSLTDASQNNLKDYSKDNLKNTLKVRTFNVFQVKGPIRKWPSFKPSIFWLWGLIPTRRILTITVGTDISYFQQSSQRLNRLIKIDFVRTLKLVRGAPFEPREEQAREILSGAEFEREIKVLSERNGISLSRGKKLAEEAFYELAASPKRFMYDALSVVAKLIVSRLFSEINVRGLDKLIPAIKEHTVILVPMHRSHLDYILVGYKLFSERMNPPLVAAGINLAFWPFGFLFRSVGAYFVKRNGRDRFHTVVLRRYVSYLVSKGHLQEFFIEGGRSRSGKMLPPKLGLLSIIIENWKPERQRDILFVPVSITYENLVEDEAFGNENSGGSKVRESIGSTVKALNVFRRRYGEVLIEFGEPISHRKYRERVESSASKQSEKVVVQRLGMELCRSIRDQINPGLTSLCYAALLNSKTYGLRKNDLIARIKSLHDYLEILRSCGIKVGTDTPQLKRFISGNSDALNELSNSDVMKLARPFGVDIFFIPGSKRFTADYYRNSVIHYFIHISLLAVAELSFGQADESNLSRLHALFEHDLLLEPWPEFWDKTRNLCHCLIAKGVLIGTDSGFVFSEKRKDLFLASFLTSYLQGYQWVCTSLLDAIEFTKSENTTLRHDKFVSKMVAAAKISTYSGEISRTETGARSTINSIVSSLEARHLIKTQEGSGAEKTLVLEDEKISHIEAEIRFLHKINNSLNVWSAVNVAVVELSDNSARKLTNPKLEE